MDVNQVRNIAPFINVVFTVTSKWWTERWGTIHKGLDIASSRTGAVGSTVYSMLTGKVLATGNTRTAGNYIIIWDDDPTSSTYGYATRYLHLEYILPFLRVGTSILSGHPVGREGKTGEGVTGIHLHVEMQNVHLFGDRWYYSDSKDDYIDPTQFMGIDNIEGTHWIYDGVVPPEPPPVHYTSKKKGFPWFIYNHDNL